VAKPEEVNHIVMSVPHSGTRTLQTYLARERNLRDFRADQVQSWHFTHHPHYCTQFLQYAEAKPETRRAYIPVRNPIDICDSWERRYNTEAGDKTAWHMTVGFGMMIALSLNYGDYIELFKMEELPRLRGHGPNPEGWEKIGPEHPRVAEVRSWILSIPKVESFYRGMYTAEELWWL
jgi:hypothetical protein